MKLNFNKRLSHFLKILFLTHTLFLSFHLSVSFGTEPEKGDLLKKGKALYMSNCIACHNVNPQKNGSLGPAVAGSSMELLRLRVLESKYPPGYTPKRKTKLMRPLLKLKDQIPSLHAFLNSF